MNILYCIPHLFNAGGMERVLTQKANWLASHTEHSITILTTEPVPPGTNECYFPLSDKVKVVNLNIGFNADYTKPLPAKYFAHMRRMRVYRRALIEYIRANSINLCISLCGKEIAFLRALPCRTIAELHFSKDHRQQLLMANHSGAFWSLLGRIRTRQLVRALKPLEQFIVLTEEDRAEWQKAGCSNVTVIPNPCSLDGTNLPKMAKTRTVLAVGRLHEQKGFDVLLHAWQHIEQVSPEWSLRIVGEGPKRKELENQINELRLQRVVMTGCVSDVKREYISASLFVLSSRYEGLPLALIEAMWCGLPCIAFDCPHGPKALLADCRGWIVPNGNTDALSEQIAYTLAHPEEAAERAEKAQAFAHTAYSEKTIMPKWLKVINGK